MSQCAGPALRSDSFRPGRWATGRPSRPRSVGHSWAQEGCCLSLVLGACFGICRCVTVCRLEDGVVATGVGGIVGGEFRGETDGLLAGLAAGSRVAGYELEERIGAGGMAVVFRARDE